MPPDGTALASFKKLLFVGLGLSQRSDKAAVAQDGNPVGVVHDLVKAALCAFLIAEGLHDLLISDHLVDDAGLLTTGGGLLLEHGVGLAGDKARNEQRHRRDDHNDERDNRIHPQHEQQRADNGEHAREELREAHEQAVSKLVDIRDHAADDLAVAVRIDIAQGKDLQPRKGIAADIAHGAVGDAVVAGGWITYQKDIAPV